jgi:hydrogenase 3 maturation protease
MTVPVGGKRLLLGIGNILNGDDGVGCYVAEGLHSSEWVTIDCATAPENFGGQVSRYGPVQVVIVDAALMGLPPGSIRRIDASSMQEVGFSTHTMSLAHFLDYITLECPDVHFFGIQPEDTSLGSPLSEPVKKSADYLIQLLKAGNLVEVPAL